MATIFRIVGRLQGFYYIKDQKGKFVAMLNKKGDLSIKRFKTLKAAEKFKSTIEYLYSRREIDNEM